MLIRNRSKVLSELISDCKYHLLKWMSDCFRCCTRGVEFPDAIFEFLFLWVTLAYLGSSTLVSVLLLSKVFVQVSLLSLTASTTVFSDAAEDMLILESWAGSCRRGSGGATGRGLKLFGDECWGVLVIEDGVEVDILQTCMQEITTFYLILKH